MRTSLLMLLFAGTLLRADGLTDLTSALARLGGQAPIKAMATYQFWSSQGKPSQPVITQGQASCSVEEGPQGLQMAWSRPLLQTAAQEASAQARDPEQKTPTRKAIAGLQPLDLWDCLNGAAALGRTLEGAQELDEKAADWQGKPARLLDLKLAPRLSRQDRKYVKDMQATAKVWIGLDGTPLAAQTDMHMKGRAMLVISFEQQSHEDYTFARVGQRLVVLRHSESSSGSGAGQQGASKTVTTLQVR